ncbi:unnamed protein product, partial [Rotaria sp. Silwood2]
QQEYYTKTNDDMPQWSILTTPQPTILIFHDESTYRSGEMSARRWIIDNNAPFFNKGKGRSVMISHYIVQHPSGPFFRLNGQEWSDAVKKYPELLDEININYEEYSATAFINIGVDDYFGNEIVLDQFDRLFKLLKFKKDFKNHLIDATVDNARTHTAK